MGDAVLVPGDRAAETGLLDEYGVVEGHKVRAVDRFRNRQKLRVAVEA
jgi:hypothetical protein